MASETCSARCRRRRRECVVRLLRVAERARDLFGTAGTDAAAGWIGVDPADSPQGSLLPEPRPLRPRTGRVAVGGDAGAPVAAAVPDRLRTATPFRAGARAERCVPRPGRNRSGTATASCASPTLFPSPIRAAALKNACPTPCPSRRRGDAGSLPSEGGEQDGYGTFVPHHDAARSLRRREADHPRHADRGGACPGAVGGRDGVGTVLDGYPDPNRDDIRSCLPFAHRAAKGL